MGMTDHASEWRRLLSPWILVPVALVVLGVPAATAIALARGGSEGPTSSATFEPAPSPTPSSAAARGTRAWPDAKSTGVPAGTALTASGSLSLTADGQVLSGLDITGCVEVKARNVTITKSRITCDSATYAVRVDDGATGLVLEDVEIDGSGKTSTAVCCGNYTIRRANIHNTIDGPRLGTNTTIVDSWIHDLARGPGSHNDAMQTTGGQNIVVRHNRLDAYNASTKDPFNAAIMVGSTNTPEVRNLLFEDNYCNGGNYTIGVRPDLKAVDVVFRNNVFGRDHRFGVVARWRHPGITWEDSNVYGDTGKPVVDR
jgi:hypothetical protein